MPFRFLLALSQMDVLLKRQQIANAFHLQHQRKNQVGRFSSVKANFRAEPTALGAKDDGK